MLTEGRWWAYSIEESVLAAVGTYKQFGSFSLLISQTSPVILFTKLPIYSPHL